MRIPKAQRLIVTKTGPGGSSAVGDASKDRATAQLGSQLKFNNFTLPDMNEVRKLRVSPLVRNLLKNSY